MTDKWPTCDYLHPTTMEFRSPGPARREPITRGQGVCFRNEVPKRRVTPDVCANCRHYAPAES